MWQLCQGFALKLLVLSQVWIDSFLLRLKWYKGIIKMISYCYVRECFLREKIMFLYHDIMIKVFPAGAGDCPLMLFDRHPEYRERYSRHFWARGYYCETIGNVNEATITKYIEEQYERDRLEGETDKGQVSKQSRF